MADLSQTKLRPTQQDRITNNRSGIVPGRRNTDAPAFERIADMRTARRGDVGGAEQLMAMFGQVTKAGNAFSDYADLKQAETDKTNASEGALDATTGDYDAELSERSRAYRISFSKGKTERDVLAHITTLEDEVNQLLDDPDHRADQEDVDELIHKSLLGYLKPDGRPRDFGSDEARDLALGHLRNAQAQLRQNAHAKIQEQVNEESLTNAADAYRLKLPMIEPTELPGAFEGAFGNLVPGVDRKKAKAAMVTATLDYADSIKEKDPVRALRITDALLGSTRNPGAVTAVDLPASGKAPAAAIAAPLTAPEVRPTRLQAPGTAGKIATALQSAGLPDVVVAGFLGNIEQESSFDSGRVGDGGRAFGHVQWRADRVENFKRVTGVSPQGASPAQTAKFIKWELDNPGKAGMTVEQRDRILAAKTPEEAAHLIDKFYERSDGKSRGDRASAARRFFGGESRGFNEDGEPVVPRIEANYAPERRTAVQQAESGDEVIVSMPKSMSLNVEERAQVGSFRRTLKGQIEQREEKERAARYDRNADLFLDRFSGIGTYPTPEEIQQARLRDDIGSEQAYRLINGIRADAERIEARADHREAELDRAEAKADKERVEHRIQALVAPVYSGGRTVSQANQLLLSLAGEISDPEERQQVIGGVRAELGAIGEMRERSPAYTAAMQGFDRLELRMVSRLPSRLRGEKRTAALKNITDAIDRYRREVGRLGVDKGDVTVAYQRAEKLLTDDYVRIYHHR